MLSLLREIGNVIWQIQENQAFPSGLYLLVSELLNFHFARIGISV